MTIFWGYIYIYRLKLRGSRFSCYCTIPMSTYSSHDTMCKAIYFRRLVHRQSRLLTIGNILNNTLHEILIYNLYFKEKQRKIIFFVFSKKVNNFFTSNSYYKIIGCASVEPCKERPVKEGQLDKKDVYYLYVIFYL